MQPLRAATGYELMWHGAICARGLDLILDDGRSGAANRLDCDRTTPTIVLGRGGGLKSCAARTRERAAGLDPAASPKRLAGMALTPGIASISSGKGLHRMVDFPVDGGHLI